jgi:DNA (cytosine-5)-methyltransferase 1
MDKIKKGFIPTPRATDGTKGSRTAAGAAKELERGKNIDLGVLIGGGSLNPMWVEWLMGFPSGWTDLEDSATQ